MKNKIISIIILATMIFPLFMVNYHVEAYSGEIDPKNYITLPSTINSDENKIGTGTISLSSSASGYSISYQKIDIDASTFNNLQTKSNQINTYISNQTAIKTQKENNLTTLQNEYQRLQSSDTATEEEVAEALDNYNTACDEYEEFIETLNTEVNRLQSELYSLIPNYTSSWQTATNASNNVQLDFSNYSETANFVLWVKITNGTDTYYDVECYSTSIREETKEPEKTDDKEPEKQEGDWTDFSKAKFTLVKDGISGASIEATGVKANKDSSYYLYISNNGNKPDITKIPNNETMSFSYREETGKFVADNVKVGSKVELNQDLYVVVIEHNNNGIKNVVSYGTKLERFSEAKYNDAFSYTHIAYNSDKISTTFTHALENDRKMEIKIGKITDTSILKKLKNQDSSAFSALMNFAKNDKGIYNQTLNADKNRSYIEYSAGVNSTENNNVIKLNGLEDEAYYYLYIKTDDENGKYISNEAVTLAQADIHDGGKWYMFFYGSSDFKWADFGTTTENDLTTMPGKLPQTGVSYVIATMIVVLIGIGIVTRIKYKKYDF